MQPLVIPRHLDYFDNDRIEPCSTFDSVRPQSRAPDAGLLEAFLCSMTVEGETEWKGQSHVMIQ
jgi:hypothetical protein